MFGTIPLRGGKKECVLRTSFDSDQLAQVPVGKDKVSTRCGLAR